MKAYFYRMTPHRPADESFDRCLRRLHQHFADQDGFYLDCDSVHLRVEKYHRYDEYCTGDIIRQQRDDIPPLAPDGALMQSSTVPLAHRTAFLYHYATRVLLLQVNKTGVGVGGLDKCIVRTLDHQGFAQIPLISQSTIDELVAGNVRKMSVRFAPPDNFTVAERTDQSDIANLNRMRRMFDAPFLEISCGFDSRKEGRLNAQAIANFIRQIYAADLQPTKVRIKHEGADELLDLLGKKMTFIDNNVRLDSGNLNGHYLARKAFLVAALADKLPFIVEYFGATAA
jgi:hypothetical protein